MLSAGQVRTRYLTLLALRWLPSGLIIPVLVLLPLSRGLSLAQVGLVAAIQGLTVLLLEVPTGGLADTFGRKPLLLVASALNVGSLILLSTATSVAAFAAYFLLQGVFRALDSGPLEAWFVDSTHASDPNARLEKGLSLGSAVLSAAIGVGALLSGAIVALDPIPGVPALAAPVVLAVGLRLAEFITMAVLLKEDRSRLAPSTTEPGSEPGSEAGSGPEAGSSAGARFWRTIRTAMGIVKRSRALKLLLAVEVLWGFGMVAFESLTPVRLAEVTASQSTAASIMGPLTAAAWLMSSAGAALAIPMTRRISVPVVAAALRVLQGLAVALIAVFGGVVGVATAFLACYLVHGASNPLHNALLHGHVGAAQRTTVTSLNSMVSQPSGALGLVALTALAGATTLSTAMLCAAVILAVAAPLYLAVRQPGRPEPVAEAS